MLRLLRSYLKSVPNLTKELRLWNIVLLTFSKRLASLPPPWAQRIPQEGITSTSVSPDLSVKPHQLREWHLQHCPSCLPPLPVDGDRF